MKALIDTNVLIDFADKREDFIEAADKVFTLCTTEKAVGFISAHSLMDMCYILRKKQTQTERLELLQQLCNLFVVVETTGESILTAAERMDFSDFEDSVVNQAAIKAGVDYIITRNPDDFKTADIPIVSPTEFIELLGETLDEETTE